MMEDEGNKMDAHFSCSLSLLLLNKFENKKKNTLPLQKPPATNQLQKR